MKPYIITAPRIEVKKNHSALTFLQMKIAWLISVYNEPRNNLQDEYSLPAFVKGTIGVEEATKFACTSSHRGEPYNIVLFHACKDSVLLINAVKTKCE